jgi:hypothetical protein
MKLIIFFAVVVFSLALAEHHIRASGIASNAASKAKSKGLSGGEIVEAHNDGQVVHLVQELPNELIYEGTLENSDGENVYFKYVLDKRSANITSFE